MKTFVATGCSSGLGFEVVKSLLEQTDEPYKFILGCRNIPVASGAFAALAYNSHIHTVHLLTLELTDLSSVKAFASAVVEKLGHEKLDYLFLNAALIIKSDVPTLGWGASYVANHLSQYYLIQLLQEKLVSSSSRIVVVSSGVVNWVTETDSLRTILEAASEADLFKIYPASKFVQLLGALYWRRQLREAGSDCEVIAVSPGLIPGTGLARHSPLHLRPTMDMPGAKLLSEGTKALLLSLKIRDLPTEDDKLFLTSGGEWWDPTEGYPLALDRNLQAEWCPSRDDIEKKAGL